MPDSACTSAIPAGALLAHAWHNPGFKMQECACWCWLLLRHGWPPAAAAAGATPSVNEGAVTPLHCTLWQVTVAVTVSCQRPHAPTATAIAGRCCCRRNISQRSFHGASRRHSASLLITLRHAVCQVPACAQKRLAAAELRCQQSCHDTTLAICVCEVMRSMCVVDQSC
eukprot:COSAG01_NODE_25_length_37050_cov_211.559119_24_plen_169_part_00